MLKIFCKNTRTFGEFQEGTTLLEMIPHFGFERPYDILSAIVNNVSEGLKFRVFNNRDVEFLDYRSYNGRNTYCRSLCFLLCKAAKDVFPKGKVVLRRPISKGYFCNVDKGDGTDLTVGDIELISDRMKKIVAEDMPFYRHEVQKPEAIELFSKMGCEDKVKLLETTDDVYLTYYTLGGTPDFYYDALVPSAGYLKVWELMPFHDGMLLRVPDRHHPEELAPMFSQPKTFDVFSESLRWNKIMNLSNVGDVNKACIEGGATDLIQIAEALQEKKIVQIAEEIDRRHFSRNHVRLVLITGPSSSGKSTFCKRLSIQLKACGLHPISFSTDDYFVNRLDTPKLPDGSFDFDNFDTVDHDALQKDVLRLLAGEEVDVPEYNFVTGIREYETHRQDSRTGEIPDFHQRHHIDLPGRPQLHPHQRQPSPEKDSSGLQQRGFHGPGDHIQLAQRPPGRSEMDISLSGRCRRTLRLDISRRIRSVQAKGRMDPFNGAEELSGVHGSQQAPQLPPLFRPGFGKRRAFHFPHQGIHRTVAVRTCT